MRCPQCGNKYCNDEGFCSRECENEYYDSFSPKPDMQETRGHDPNIDVLMTQVEKLCAIIDRCISIMEETQKRIDLLNTRLTIVEKLVNTHEHENMMHRPLR